MTTSAVYLRISKDKALGTESEGLAVDRQRKDIHKMLKAKGWKAGKEYLENDTSASGKVPRPEYQRMLADYAAGEFDAISAWDLDRLWRVPMEFEHLLTLVDKEGLRLATVGGEADLATDNGILYARIKVAVAASELSRRSARQKAKFAQDREAGKDHWRGRRPFGLTLEGKEVPEEADAIRAVAESVLDGGTISAGADYLNKAGIKTTFGGEWGRQPLRRTLMHPRLAGLREHNGELIEGNWDAVLERDTWEAVVAKLNTPGRAKPKRTDREYLLTGLITCAECGGKAYGIPTRKKLSSGVIKIGYVYRCANTHVSKSMVPTDNLVILKTLEALLSTDYEEVEADKDALKALREARAHELKDWSDWQQEAADEGLRPSEIRPARERHETRLRDIEHRIAELEKVSLVRMPTLDELAESTADDNGQIELVFDWDALSLEKRRRLITTVWESITIHGQKKGARWDDSTIVLVRRKL
jgi:DNA invertase Pin-like site-specific DNA recombinase